MNEINREAGISPVLSTDGLANDEGKERNRCVVRLRTTTWANNKGLHIKHSLTYLRRQCVGFNVLAEDESAIGAESIIGSITNLAECKDGIYEAVICNVSHDWETGYADDWGYKLVPISTANAKVKGGRDEQN